MDSEREIMELLESLERFDLDALLKEIADFDLDALLASLHDSTKQLLGELWDTPTRRKPRRTRNRNTGKPSKPNT